MCIFFFSLIRCVAPAFNRRNMILMDVLEERQIDPKDYEGSTCKSERLPVQRELSQAMIPGKHLVKVEIEKEIYDKKMAQES